MRGQRLEDLLRQASTNEAALIDFSQRLAYGEVLLRVEAMAAALRRAGVDRSDRVAIVTPNGIGSAVALLGVASCAIAAPLNPAYSEDEFNFYFGDLGARVLVTVPGTSPLAERTATARGVPIMDLAAVTSSAVSGFAARSPEAGNRGPEDIALILHTSGTTARPKMVPLTHANLLSSARNVAGTLQLGPADRCLNMMPLFHIHGIVAALLATLASGGSVACLPGFSAADFGRGLRELGPSWYSAVPTIHQGVLAAIARHPEMIEGHSLRFIRSSSASLPVRTLEDLESSFGVPVVEAYGMTEAAHQMASNPLPPADRKPTSVGPAAGPEIAVMDEAGALVSRATIGEVVIRGPNVIGGYLNNSDANSSAFVDGWFRTGDQGYIDADGYLFLTGRLKELINRGGEKVAPAEVEQVLMQHPSVAMAVAFAIPEQRLGEEVGAAIVLKDGVTADVPGVRAHAAARLAYFKVPKRIVVLDELPKGPTGKLQRIGLAARLGIGTDAAPPTASPAPLLSELVERITAVWEEHLEVTDLDRQDDFFAVGGDSLTAARVVDRLSAELSVHIPLYEFFDAPTVEGLAHAIVRRRDASLSTDAELQPILGERSGPALFFSHGQLRDDNVPPAYCLSLARELGAGRAVYAVQPPMAHELTGRLEHVARSRIREMRRVQPDGPYDLVGYCNGAALAFEIARELTTDGQRVGRLIIIEAFAPTRRLATVRRAADTLCCRLLGERRGIDASVSLRRGARAVLKPRTKYKLSDSEDDLGRSAYDRMLAVYVPRHFPGPVTLMLPAEEYESVEGKRLGWGKLARSVDVLEVPGGHSTCITVHTAALAETLERIVAT